MNDSLINKFDYDLSSNNIHPKVEEWYYNKLPKLVPLLLGSQNQFIRFVGEGIDNIIKGDFKEIDKLSESLMSKRELYSPKTDEEWFLGFKDNLNERKILYENITEQLLIDIIGIDHFKELKDSWFMRYFEGNDFMTPLEFACGYRTGSYYMKPHDVHKDGFHGTTISDSINDLLLNLSEDLLISFLSIPNNYKIMSCKEKLKASAKMYYDNFFSASCCPP